ncbi:vacuolar protein-sorting-associated protein 25 isoform X2 [Ammospiza nelsoni]|uniref:vacuolar protein-sorting-associated protein 25 isoform X2 n=1 Tax=Ammospiza nelsoni TaxID=2857394 RepID=UPI00286AF8C4|nr:vacuolar protein-sorting-associated protein 25 isoform X2 [Ammospiza nelsoni]
MSFVWPWQYSFPPFFTLQPNGETRQKQLAAWCALALAYSQEHRLPAMTVREAQDIPLFANHRLQRKLPLESIQVVLEELRKNGNLEWLDKNKTSFLIMWKRPEEWGKLIYQWVRAHPDQAVSMRMGDPGCYLGNGTACVQEWPDQLCVHAVRAGQWG